MISLVPNWAMHMNAFWLEVKNRNHWFIKLRYGAVALLLSFIFFCDIVFGFIFKTDQMIAILSVTLFAFLYNVALKFFSGKIPANSEKFNLLHFSILQMILDFFTLALLIYFTGGIESPLYMLYIFHMIIGSLILPGKVVYTLAFLVIVYFLSFSLLEYFSIIPHHAIGGLYTELLYKNLKYVLMKNVFFGFVIILCVFIANHIAHQLYTLEQDLVDSFDKLKKAEQEKQKYTMMVVHEIKSPLTAVYSLLEIIMTKMLGPINEQIEYKVQRALIRCKEAIELINNVLKISRLRLLDEIKKESILLNDLINLVIDKQSTFAESKKINIINLTSPDELIKIYGDQFYLELIFSNLINNSIKYSKDNGIIEIMAFSKENNAVIQISDTGIGIPQKDLTKIFNDFFRASNIKDKGIEGTGLGLSAVKQLIEKHDGTIKITSPSIIGAEGSPGTTVEFTLPLSA